MIKLLVIFYLVAIFSKIEIVTAEGWSYEKIDEWPEQCSSGQLQSPIDLPSKSAETVHFKQFVFNGYDETFSANVTNNGHTVVVKLNSPLQPLIYGGGFRSEFVLDSFHFHWDSEHTIDNKRYPLEMHLVHYISSKRNLPSALSQRHGVAVLGVLFEESYEDNRIFDQLFGAVKQLQEAKEEHPTLKIPALKLSDFLPDDRDGFYRYMGSLTTPPCTENIIWTVFTKPLSLSKGQIKVFSKLLNSEHAPLSSNFRPIQKTNNRNIYLQFNAKDNAGHFSVDISVKILMLLISFFKLL